MSVNIVVPEMGESIVDARVAKWLKNEGEPVSAGEALVELETDKVDVEVAAPKAGVLEKIAHGKGDDVKIGDVLGTIGDIGGPLSLGSGSGPGLGARGRLGGSETPAKAETGGAKSVEKPRPVRKPKHVEIAAPKPPKPVALPSKITTFLAG